MNERLSLLTLIILGEGVIGSTKTVGYIWPDEATPSGNGIFAMFSIIIMLVSFVFSDG
jgi:low temperature requirement protein LtrA